MCGHGGCNCGHECNCGGHGHHHRSHDRGGGCNCGQDAGGCQCGGGESGSCSCSQGESQGCDCGQGGHGEHHGHHQHHGHYGEQPMGFSRRFVSRAERLAELEGYLAELRAEIEAGQAYLKDVQAEATAVEERIASLKAA
jgi:hypothetical protein